METNKTKIEEDPREEEIQNTSTEANSVSEEECTEEELKKAEIQKEKGNDCFKNCKFEEALDHYSEAIFCKVTNKKKAVYYCNRSLVNLKLENYAIALFDAKDSIKCDKDYAKAYYRLG